MKPAARDDHGGNPIVILERAVSSAEPRQLAILLGDLERLKATIWQRLLLITTTQLGAGPVDPIEDLRHLTAHQVGALLGLKAAYVHELCRTGRITATKSGKYWLIPLAAAIVVGVSEE
jgi:hypothetical protein